MPTFAPDTARNAFKFKGHAVNVPFLYATGHALTELEARFVNKQLASVTGNALASALTRKIAALQTANDALPDGTEGKRGTDAPFTEKDIDTTTVQSMFDEIFTNYEVGATATRGEGIARDPIQSIADNIAWERIKVMLTQRNIKVGSVKADQKAKLIGQLHEKDPSILEQAKATFNAVKPLDGLDDMFAGVGAAEAETPAETTETPADEINDSAATVADRADDEPEVADANEVEIEAETVDDTPVSTSGAFA
ncbi:hypothetical protein Kuura_050 [Caulobacter phage Kuura]|nr:hypothetical protein Kuura_050 [Caulobacter phage Kuura]